MSDPQRMSGVDREAVQRGLRMAHPPSPERLAAERVALAELEEHGPKTRLLGYWRLVGPGYLQSAMTLGGGTAVSSLLAGALFGYALLWVAPVAMLIGMVMLVNPIMRAYWFSILIGWLAKSLVTKYGNKDTYARIRGLFIGLIVGELFIVVLSMVLSLALEARMGIDLNRN